MALWLWCPHLLIDIDGLAQSSTLACTHIHTHTHVPMQSSTHTQAYNIHSKTHMYSQTHQPTYTQSCIHTQMPHTQPQKYTYAYTVSNTSSWHSHAHKHTNIQSPLNLYTQKPRVTTSLSAVKPRNYVKPLSVFILPIPNHASSSPPFLFASALQFGMITLLTHMTDNPEIRELIDIPLASTVTRFICAEFDCVCPPSHIEKVTVRVCNHANQSVFTVYNQLRL